MLTDQEIEAIVLTQIGFDGDGLQEVNMRDLHRVARAVLAAAQAKSTEVPVPATEDQAAGMALVGTAWLQEHAPHRLTAQAKPEGAKSGPQWQLIETAPKDGSMVMLHGTLAGEVSGIDLLPKCLVGRYEGRGDYAADGYVWAVVSGDMYATWCRPTHWMPIPAAPSAEGDNQ